MIYVLISNTADGIRSVAGIFEDLGGVERAQARLQARSESELTWKVLASDKTFQQVSTLVEMGWLEVPS